MCVRWRGEWNECEMAPLAMTEQKEQEKEKIQKCLTRHQISISGSNLPKFCWMQMFSLLCPFLAWSE